MHEWALLIFTVCMQAAIGGMFMLWFYHRKISKLGENEAFKVMRIPLIIMAGLAIVGLMASFAHLGTPSHALNTIRHAGSSWMSREIIVTSIFIALAIVMIVLVLVQKKVNQWIILVTSLVGIVDIYCMGAIYANTLVSGWNSLNTYTSFFGTAIVLGSVLAASLIVLMERNTGREELSQYLVKTSFIVAMFGLAVQVIGIALFGVSIPDVQMITGTSALALLEGYQGMVVLRWIIELVGVALLGYLVLSKNKKATLSLALIALAAIIVAEGLNRYVFYVVGA